MRSISILCLLAVSSAVGNAAIVTLQFDELATQAANGLSIYGVSIGFTVGGSPSTDATFNAELPVLATYLDDRVLIGPASGVLALQFAFATSTLQFGLILNTLDAEQPGALIELFDGASQSLGVTPLDTNPLLLFSEGQFSYSGVPISRAEISMSANTAANLFAVDNLQYEISDVDPIPEPATALLAGTVSLLFLLRSRRRKLL